MPRLRVRRLGYALGAEISGLDLRERLDDATIAEIRNAWLEHLVLCFPAQNIDKRELLAFAERFGEPASGTRHPDADAPNVKVLTNRPVPGKAASPYKDGHNWHSDKSFSVRPSSATFLCCAETPEAGGNTMFANMYLAYETLSPLMREIVDGLSGVHNILRPRYDAAFTTGGTDPRARTPIVQPAVRVHPETGRKALYLGYRVHRFAGMTDEESRPLLDFLNLHATRYEFTYRHRWTVGDLILWDNRAMMHIALSDYDLDRDMRTMFGVELLGPKSGYPETDDDALKPPATDLAKQAPA